MGYLWPGPYLASVRRNGLCQLEVSDLDTFFFDFTTAVLLANVADETLDSWIKSVEQVKEENARRQSQEEARTEAVEISLEEEEEEAEEAEGDGIEDDEFVRAGEDPEAALQTPFTPPPKTTTGSKQTSTAGKGTADSQLLSETQTKSSPSLSRKYEWKEKRFSESI